MCVCVCHPGIALDAGGEAWHRIKACLEHRTSLMNFSVREGPTMTGTGQSYELRDLATKLFVERYLTCGSGITSRGSDSSSSGREDSSSNLLFLMDSHFPPVIDCCSAQWQSTGFPMAFPTEQAHPHDPR